MKRTLWTEKEYDNLPQKDRLYYEPVYKGYKTEKFRDYEYCDLGHRHYIGWRERTVPIGEPLRYRWREPDIMTLLWADKIAGMTQAYTVVSRRIAKRIKESGGSVIEIPFKKRKNNA
jgi:hypothetical protein